MFVIKKVSVYNFFLPKETFLDINIWQGKKNNIHQIQLISTLFIFIRISIFIQLNSSKEPPSVKSASYLKIMKMFTTFL